MEYLTLRRLSYVLRSEKVASIFFANERKRERFLFYFSSTVPRPGSRTPGAARKSRAATMQATPSLGGAGLAPSILATRVIIGRRAVAALRTRARESSRERAVFARVAGVSGRGA